MQEENQVKASINDFLDIINFHIDNSMLINIERNNLSDEPICGFPISVSKEIVILSQIFDFHYEGVAIIRLSDITDVFSTENDVFYEKICKLEQLHTKHKHLIKCEDKVESLYQALKLFSNYEKFITVRCENLRNELAFSIGHVKELCDKYLIFKNFDRLGLWDECYRNIYIKDITQICIDDYYSNMYYNYMNKFKMI